MKQTFKIGDVVALRSGSPELTVVRVEEAAPGGAGGSSPTSVSTGIRGSGGAGGSSPTSASPVPAGATIGGGGGGGNAVAVGPTGPTDGVVFAMYFSAGEFKSCVLHVSTLALIRRPAQENLPRPGDVVALRSGSPEMTVSSFAKTGDGGLLVTVCYFYNEELQLQTLPPDCLAAVRSE